jgi:hypothetical protein
MKHIYICFCALFCLAHQQVQADSLSCETLKTRIAADLDSKGIRYRLEVRTNGDSDGMTIVGHCDGGTKIITYAALASDRAAPTSVPIATSSPPTKSALTWSGLGNIQLGMSLDSANAAAGLKLEHNASGDCFFAHLPNNPDKPEFLFQAGKLARIFAGPDSVIRGVKIGSRMQEVRSAFYDSRIRLAKTYYGSFPLIYITNTKSTNTLYFIFDGHNKVDEFGVGNGRAVELEEFEGCLR